MLEVGEVLVNALDVHITVGPEHWQSNALRKSFGQLHVANENAAHLPCLNVRLATYAVCWYANLGQGLVKPVAAVNLLCAWLTERPPVSVACREVPRWCLARTGMDS